VCASAYIVAANPALDAGLQRLVSRKAVFFAGLPGTGKSLLVHQLAHLAHSRGRRVHLLQWDVARPIFEAAPAGQRYPIVDGVTHVVIRRAVGLWARTRILEWWQANPGPAHLLLGEVPLAGDRLAELVTPAPDGAEALLASPDCVFVLSVPSNDVRRHIEAERARRFEAPLHARELEDAPPDVMRDTWRDLLASARESGLLRAGTRAGDRYDSGVYRVVYEHLLRHRNSVVLRIDAVLPTQAMSVYNYPDGSVFVLPNPKDVARWIERAEGGFGV